MKILATGDWHIRKKRPKNRLDIDYFNTTIRNKILQIFEIAEIEKCKIILQPGDLCDTSELTYQTVRDVIQLLSQSPAPILTVPGQHDLHFHSRIWENTPLGVFDALNYPVKVIRHYAYKDIYIHGARYGQKISPKFPNHKGMKILICHKMIINKAIPFDFDYTAKGILQEFPKFDLIVSGDNHKSLTESIEGRLLLNCGSLIRTKIDQITHRPRVYVYDTLNGNYDTYYLDVEPSEKVLNIEKTEEDDKRKKKIQDFVDALDNTNDNFGEESVNFRKHLSNKIARNKKRMSKGMIEILEEVMKEDVGSN